MTYNYDDENDLYTGEYFDEIQENWLIKLNNRNNTTWATKQEAISEILKILNSHSDSDFENNIVVVTKKIGFEDEPFENFEELEQHLTDCDRIEFYDVIDDLIKELDLDIIIELYNLDGSEQDFEE